MLITATHPKTIIASHRIFASGVRGRLSATCAMTSFSQLILGAGRIISIFRARPRLFPFAASRDAAHRL